MTNEGYSEVRQGQAYQPLRLEYDRETKTRMIEERKKQEEERQKQLKDGQSTTQKDVGNQEADPTDRE